MAAIRWTKQYWAVRRDLDWVMTSKVRSPIEAITQVWGAAAANDPVLALGLDPTPYVAGTERYDAMYEIVDLGRNKKEADGKLPELKASAREEQQRRNILAYDADERAQATITRWRDGKKHGFEQISEAIKHMVDLASFFNKSAGAEQLVNAEAEAFVADILAAHMKNCVAEAEVAREPVAALALTRTIAVVKEKLATVGLLDHLRPFCAGYQIQRRMRLTEAVKELAVQLQAIENRKPAVADRRRRDALKAEREKALAQATPLPAPVVVAPKIEVPPSQPTPPPVVPVQAPTP